MDLCTIYGFTFKFDLIILAIIHEENKLLHINYSIQINMVVYKFI